MNLVLFKIKITFLNEMFHLEESNIRFELLWLLEEVAVGYILYLVQYYRHFHKHLLYHQHKHNDSNLKTFLFFYF